MAIGLVQTVIATGVNNTSATTFAATIAAGHDTTAGNTLLLHVGAFHTVSSVTDSKGNTWTVDAQASGTSQDPTVCVASCVVTTALVAGDTITGHFSGSTSASYALFEWSGTMTADVSSSATGSTTAASAGTTATTSAANELVIGAWAIQGAKPLTAGSGFTLLSAGGVPTSFGRPVYSEYEIVAATGTQTATGTFATAGGWAGVCIAYAPAATTPTNQFFPFLTP